MASGMVSGNGDGDGDGQGQGQQLTPRGVEWQTAVQFELLLFGGRGLNPTHPHTVPPIHGHQWWLICLLRLSPFRSLNLLDVRPSARCKSFFFLCIPCPSKCVSE